MENIVTEAKNQEQKGRKIEELGHCFVVVYAFCHTNRY